MGWIEAFFTPLAIPVLAIIAGILAIAMRHRERMAMIERGMHPDLDAEEQRRARLGDPSRANASPQSYNNPAQNQPGPSPLGRR